MQQRQQTAADGGVAPPAFAPAREALFLDFDGTLVDIAARPEAIEVPRALVPLLARLHGAASRAVAVVSGRSLPELERFLDGFDGVLIGSHGAEWRGIGGDVTPPPEGLEPLHREVRRLAGEAGLLAEIKSRGAALHFRHAPAREAEARALADRLAAVYRAFTVQPAKMAFELKPEGATKDRALARLAGEAPFAGRRPVYLGDDATDEPALAWAIAQGGLAVKVGDGPSVAPHRLGGPAEVLAWLSRALEES